MYHAYVLVSEKTGRRYTGSCGDLGDRVHRHNMGYVKPTKHGVPWRLVHSETFDTRSEAFRRELQLKTGVGREQLDRLLG